MKVVAMELKAACSVALWLAIEDYAGLWEVIWEINTIAPELQENEKKNLAITAVKELLDRGWVELLSSDESTGSMTQIDQASVARIIEQEDSWREPAASGRSTRMSATPAGEAAYSEYFEARPDQPGQ